jgi:tRNA pseudouridine55 synthase
MYSALKQEGVPLYKLARKGMEVEREARRVRISSLRLEIAAADRLRFEVACSKGTYVRVLAEDIGGALQTTAHLSVLRRTRFGPFGVEQAIDLQSWDPTDDTSLLPIREALADLPLRHVSERVTLAVRQGKTWVLDEIEAAPEGSVALLVAPSQHPVAVVVRRGGRWSFGRVLSDAATLQGSVPVLTNRG